MADHPRRRWFALGVLCALQFMVVLDVAIVNVALPSIRTDLHFSQESLQWVITAYSIVFGGVLMIPQLAGPCACNGRFAERAPIRCPNCRSTDATTTVTAMVD